MNYDRQDLSDNLDKYLIGIDEEFAFKCRKCGKCCKNRNDVMLNSRDLYNIAKKLGITTMQVIEKYCETFIGADSNLPIVILKFGGSKNACPLLNTKGLCLVQDMKPVICALFPLGRIVKGDNLDNFVSAEYTAINFIIQPVQCGSISRKQTVRGWLERFGIPVEDNFYVKWSQLIFSLSTSIQKLMQSKKVTGKIIEMLQNGIGSALYSSYDINKEFMPQFIENFDKILKMITGIELMITDKENNIRGPM